MTQENGTSPKLSLTARLEALLLAAPAAAGTGQLAQALEVTPREIEKALAELDERYASGGLRVQRFRGGVQLTTAPEAAEDVERFLGLEASARLSRAALETLAVVAYQQPVTRPQIDSVRGVNSDSVLKTLLSFGLIEEAGRAEAVGRPILYTLTSQFMQHFGLNSLDELPPLDGEPDPADGSAEVETTSEESE